MKQRFFVVAIALAAMLALPAWAQLTPYCQDFEALDPADPAALSDDGWLVFANVFNPGGGFAYNYGPFPAPNSTADGVPDAFSGVASGEGGDDQGLQQLNVFSDYQNGDHGNGLLIEANVFQEQSVDAADVGNTWVFQFDAKRGPIGGNTTALAFFKTIDPNNGFALTNFITVDMTSVSTEWSGYLLSIFIDPSLAGQILQFGFLSTATNFDPSGIFYDNVTFINLDDQCDDEACDDEDDDEYGDGNGGNADAVGGTENTGGEGGGNQGLGSNPNAGSGTVGLDTIEEIEGQEPIRRERGGSNRQVDRNRGR